MYLPEGQDRLRRLRETYIEVLAATKHEDDKIGRFLAAIAFLVAAALVFVDPRVLRVHYALGQAELPLPAIALASFLGTVTLAVLVYVLAAGTPLTIPPNPRTPRRSSGPHRSHLFFDRIALETGASWRNMWETSESQELEKALINDYIGETLNLARRARNKRRRSLEASALFILGLLFFAVAVLLSVHAIGLLPSGDASSADRAVLGWTLSLRTTLAAGLALFSAALIYQQRRVRQLTADQPEDDPKVGWWLLVAGYASFPVLTLLPLGWSLLQRIPTGVGALGAALVTFAGHRIVRRHDGEGSEDEESRDRERVERVSTLALSLVFGFAALAVVAADRPEGQLLTSTVAAATPLLGTVVSSFQETRRMRDHRNALTSASGRESHH